MRYFFYFLLTINIIFIPTGIWAQDKDSVVDQALDEVETVVPDGSGASAAASSPEAEGKEPASGVEPVLTAKDPSDRKITEQLDFVEFKDTDIISALKIIENKSQLDIVFDPQVTGKVSLRIENINVWDILKIIARTNRLAYYEKDGTVQVILADDYRKQFGREFLEGQDVRILPLAYADPESVQAQVRQRLSLDGRMFCSNKPPAIVLIETPAQIATLAEAIASWDVEVKTEIFDVRYADTQEIADKLKDVLSKNLGQIRADRKAGRIIVTDTEDNIAKVADLIKKIDRVQTVRFDVEVVQVTLGEEHLDGIDWEAIVSDYLALTGPGGSSPSQERLSVGELTVEDHAVLLEALEMVGDMRNVVSRDHQAESGQVLDLHLKVAGEDMLLSIPSSAATPGNSPSGAPGDLDVRFSFSPAAHLDGSLTATLTFAGGPPQPTATLRIGRDQVIVVGGVFKEEKIDKTKKFPILGHIPILGFVFRSRTTDTIKYEYVFFITPRVVPAS